MEQLEQLTKIQKELKAPKSQFNAFGKYKYRNCEDILEAVKPLMSDDCSLVLFDTIEHIGDRYYVKATAMFSCGLVTVSITAFAREEQDKKGMDAAQITGAASSYARKYALNGLFLIDDTKDADHGDNSKKLEKEPDVPQSVEDKPRPVTPAQKKVLAGLMEKEGMPVEDQKAFYGYVAPKDYDAAQTFIENFNGYFKTFDNVRKGELNV